MVYGEPAGRKRGGEGNLLDLSIFGVISIHGDCEHCLELFYWFVEKMSFGQYS